MMCHRRTEKRAELTATFVLELPNRVGHGTAILEHRTRAGKPLNERGARSAKDRGAISQRVTPGAPGRGEQGQKPVEERAHEAVSAGRDRGCVRPADWVLVVVRLAAQNRKRAVDLFCEEQASEAVRQGHRGERESKVRVCRKLCWQAVGATD